MYQGRLTVIMIKVVTKVVIVGVVVVVVVGFKGALQQLEAGALHVLVGQTFEVGRSLAGVEIFTWNEPGFCRFRQTEHTAIKRRENLKKTKTKKPREKRTGKSFRKLKNVQN